VQQFEVLWRDYRTKGWEREETFSMFGVEETWSDADELAPDKFFMRRRKLPS
jgi:hypothetical protein